MDKKSKNKLDISNGTETNTTSTDFVPMILRESSADFENSS
jgi:hypothetical protein